MTTILVIHPGGLGDVLLGVPALRALRRAYPTAELGLVCGSEVGGLLACCGEVARVFPLEGPALTELLSGPTTLAPDLRTWLAGCVLGVAWMQDPDGALAATWSACGVNAMVIQRAYDPCDPRSQAEVTHQAEKLILALPVPQTMSTQPFSIPERVVNEGVTVLGQLGLSTAHLVGIHPGSGSLHKCGGPELMAQVIDEVRAQGRTPLVLQGPADANTVKAVVDRFTDRPPVVSGLSLISLAGVLAHLELYVGYDSGLSHLSAWLGRPTVALFGPTDSRCWAPCGQFVAILRGADCACRTWQAVHACAQKPCLTPPVQLIFKAEQSLRSRADRVDPLGASACSHPSVVLQSHATFSLK